MMWEERLNRTRSNFKKELEDCIINAFNPCCHAANWNHLKDRIIKYIAETLEEELKQQIQSEIDNMLQDMKLTVEQWLEYYKQHNEDGYYDSWIEMFWIDEAPDKKDEEEYYMMRMYEKFVKEGVIEIYYFGSAPDEIKQSFLDKWYQRYSFPYSENEVLDIYIGQKDKAGKFYENMGAFLNQWTVRKNRTGGGWLKMYYRILILNLSSCF